jgi:hypothetical protein
MGAACSEDAEANYGGSRVIDATATRTPPATATKPDAPEVWTLSFRPCGDGPDTAMRIKKLLQLALRVCGLRCVKLGELKGGTR